MRGNYGYYSGRTKARIEVGQTFVTVHKASGAVETAGILETVVNAKTGRAESVLLDRIIHDYSSEFEGWDAAGCFVTELVPSKT